MSRSERGGDFEVGRVVAERYEILEAIGHGTSGTVYRARDLYVDSDAEIVALKAIHAHLHNDRQIFGRFRREVDILRRLTGPNLCKMLECIEEDGLLLIVLEHVDGPALDTFLAEHPRLPLFEVVAIMTQICAALEVAHGAGVIHRDLKPSNVLIEGALSGADDGAPPSFLRELSVRVVDFGLAKMIQGDMTGTALTEVDMIFGTPDYMSPEQVAGEELDARCDIYAAGAMLFEMVVGRVPFDTPGPLTTMAAHLHEPLPAPRTVAPERDIPRAVERVIMRALAKAPEDRYPSARALGEALERAARGEVDGGPEEAALADDDTADGLASEEGVAAADESLEHAQTAISTTMQSHKDEALEAARRKKGPKIEVVVREAPASNPPAPRTSKSRVGAADGEKRLFIVIAVVAALLAVAAGVYLGSG